MLSIWWVDSQTSVQIFWSLCLFQLVHNVTQRASLVGNASLTVAVRTERTVTKWQDNVSVVVNKGDMALAVSLVSLVGNVETAVVSCIYSYRSVMLSGVESRTICCLVLKVSLFAKFSRTFTRRCICVAKKKKNIWAPSSEFVSSSIPSWQILTAHAQPFRGARALAFCLKVPLDSLPVWASSGGSGETARMRRLAWTFAARIGVKYQIRLTRSIWD